MNKKALSNYNYGHHIFAVIILALAVLIILQFTKIPLFEIIKENPILSFGLVFTYIIFSGFLELLEPPSTMNHRGPFHSKIALGIYLILIPITFEKGITTNNIYWFFASAILCANSVHLFGDSLTKNLSLF